MSSGARKELDRVQVTFGLSKIRCWVNPFLCNPGDIFRIYWWARLQNEDMRGLAAGATTRGDGVTARDCIGRAEVYFTFLKIWVSARCPPTDLAGIIRLCVEVYRSTGFG